MLPVTTVLVFVPFARCPRVLGIGGKVIDKRDANARWKVVGSNPNTDRRDVC